MSFLFPYRHYQRLSYHFLSDNYHNLQNVLNCTFMFFGFRRTPRIKAEGEMGRKSRRYSLGTGPNKLHKSKSVPELHPAEEYKIRKEKQKECVYFCSLICCIYIVNMFEIYQTIWFFNFCHPLTLHRVKFAMKMIILHITYV